MDPPKKEGKEAAAASCVGQLDRDRAADHQDCGSIQERARMLRVAAPLAFVVLLSTVVESATNRDSEVQCSRTCVAVECNTVGIRYGKYCGVGWTGCPGEKPCDDLDACCKVHDDCVGKKGMMDIKCHEKFKRCIKKVRKSGKVGFSQECPYETVVPTMVQGMDMAIMLSQMGSAKFEL